MNKESLKYIINFLDEWMTIINEARSTEIKTIVFSILTCTVICMLITFIAFISFLLNVLFDIGFALPFVTISCTFGFCLIFYMVVENGL